MSDHQEEQEMEAEALAAIFDTSFSIISSKRPFVWSVKLVPIDCGGDEEEEAKQNHVAVKLIVTVPLEYPDVMPELEIEVLKGLAEEQRKEILSVATDEAEANAGMPAIFAVAEAIRAWLADNNVKGQDDGSMYAQMMRRAKEKEKSKEKAAQIFEAQKKQEEFTEAEKEEMAVRKRRAEGTPCTKENFLTWLAGFDKEMMAQAAAEEQERNESQGSSKKNKDKVKEDTTSQRMTGYDYFSGKAGLISLEAMEAAVDDMEDGDGGGGVEVEDLDVDEELFDDDDDLDDLDFDSDDDDDDDDELDI